jgi:hypothetical protein
MRDNPHRHHQGSIRLTGYAYAQAGAYFITICTSDQACLFEEVVDGEVVKRRWCERNGCGMRCCLA